MKVTAKRWEILSKTDKENIVDVLLENRGIKTKKDKEEFLNPIDPLEIRLKDLDISDLEIRKAIKRIELAKKNKEHVVVYGDYDADGITGTATMWETLHEIGLDVLPHIPERFTEGYGLNIESVKKLKEKDPELKLIITVDHGIVAGKKVAEAKKMGIDMIISDHHQAGTAKPKPLALVYTTKIGGSAISWFLSREISKHFKLPVKSIRNKLQLAAIGTIADQLPLTGANRSIVKYGLEELNKTTRPGFLALFEDAGLTTGGFLKNPIGTYEINFIIAPRINSMGRLKHGLESLRLICTKDKLKAREIAKNIGDTNSERQRIVEEVVVHAQKSFKDITNQSVIILAHESYHEGVIGLAAARLVEEFYRPAIVLSKKGEISKASARSISGFNIIEAIRNFESLYIEGGGHPMAAGFSIETKNITEFSKKLNAYAKKLLTDDLLLRKLKIDCTVSFKQINRNLLEIVKEFEPTGIGNPTPTFASNDVGVVDFKTVGGDGRHLKLKLEQDGHIFDSIFFGGGEMYSKFTPDAKIDVTFQIEENIWNGNRGLQLKVKDIHFV